MKITNAALAANLNLFKLQYKYTFQANQLGLNDKPRHTLSVVVLFVLLRLCS